MACVVFLCAAFLILAFCQTAHVVKGLYCQDPDTGKLYTVNTTWPSQTFCGNYTCKLRKRNVTETQYTPIRKINISKYIIHKEDSENDMTISPSENSIIITKKVDNKQPIFHKNLLKMNEKDPIFTKKDIKNDDRYLTETEIIAITEMLHTVKKSDLEAIIDIYNLAQEIYKEIDSVNPEKQDQDTKSENLETFKGKINKQSYWHDSFQYQIKNNEDMSHEGTDFITTMKPASYSIPTFFKGPLTEKDFGKVPYYYPISNFQRYSSYMHTKPSSYDLEKAPTQTKPCKKPVESSYVSMHEKPAKTTDAQQTIQPTLLPYPFSYIYHYNVSGYPSSYYYNYPWAHFNYSRQRNYPQPYYGPYVAQIPNYGYTKSETSHREETLETKSMENDLFDQLIEKPLEKQTLADWQTEPLSDKVLEEVRAHIIEKPKSVKSIPLKKNVKLERVGKVIKLDELSRLKREVENNIIGVFDAGSEDEFETYIEKTKCEDSTDPGYFSVGNMTQPYPGCCPQKIENVHITPTVSLNVNN